MGLGLGLGLGLRVGVGVRARARVRVRARARARVRVTSRWSSTTGSTMCVDSPSPVTLKRVSELNAGWTRS